jgi:hypothetical protein
VLVGSTVAARPAMLRPALHVDHRLMPTFRAETTAARRTAFRLHPARARDADSAAS